MLIKVGFILKITKVVYKFRIKGNFLPLLKTTFKFKMWGKALN